MRTSTDSSLPRRLGLYAAALAGVAAVAAASGWAIGPDAPAATGHAMEQAHAMDGEAAGGLAVSAHGATLSVAPTTLVAGRPADLRLRVLDAEGTPIRDFDEEVPGVRVHLIVVRRDLTGYQHLHPTLAPDGTLHTRLTLPAGGAWRAFADFERGGEKTVLATDLLAAGRFDPVPLPPVRSTATTDGYRIERSGAAHAGSEADVHFRITRNGRGVALQPYLGAQGHLVALRRGDLAYLHVHPLDGDARGEVRFAATFPSAGTYRLFLQFRHDGRVHTAPFTLEVER